MEKSDLHPLTQVLLNISKIELTKQKKVSLLAVTKKTHAKKVQELFDLGQRLFGENYVDEIIEKSAELTKEIQWHFIGHLQTNKVKKLLQIENLTTIESVDSINLASTIDKQCQKMNREVNIYIQVNISDEDSKSGCKIEECSTICKYIVENCKYIKLKGLMALGTIGSTEEFNLLYDLKLKISKELNIDPNDFGISNGTSSDYEEAIRCGSTEVRLGSILIKQIDFETQEKINSIDNEQNKCEVIDKTEKDN